MDLQNKTVELNGSLSGYKKSDSAANGAAEDTIKTAKGRLPKIVSALTEKAKQNDGKLTWGDLDKIIKSSGLENDTDEIEEILSICEREGIAITDEDTPLEDMDDGDLTAEGATLEQDEGLAAVETAEVSSDDAESSKTTMRPHPPTPPRSCCSKNNSKMFWEL